MKKEFEFKYTDGKFLISKKGGTDETCFSIDAETLQFDTKKFYELLFLDVNEYMEIEIINKCNFVTQDDSGIEKRAKHVFDTIEDITKGICLNLNEQCFTSDDPE